MPPCTDDYLLPTPQIFVSLKTYMLLQGFTPTFPVNVLFLDILVNLPKLSTTYPSFERRVS